MGLTAYSFVPEQVKDSQMRGVLVRALNNVRSAGNFFQNREDRGEYENTIEEAKNRFGLGEYGDSDFQMHDRLEGYVKRVIEGKLFGFITAKKGGKDIFFHRNGLMSHDQWEELCEGRGVMFSVGSNDHGYCAVDIEPS